MTSRDFVYWLQGFAELSKEPPTPEQWTQIKNHLNLVFVHEIDGPDPDGKLQAAHDGKPATSTPSRPPLGPNTLLRC